MSRDGSYGRAVQRQRYRCIAPGGAFHRFTPTLPRERTEDGVCWACDSTVHAHAGPVVSRGYRHRLHLVAEALVAVRRGVSYTRAAQRARVAGDRDPLPGSGSGQMVAEWVDVWAPSILAAYAETEWPETLVLDSTDFSWTTPALGSGAASSPSSSPTGTPVRVSAGSGASTLHPPHKPRTGSTSCAG